ncbi:AP2 domain transcription factor AP2-O5, putative [Plasmodium vivax]|nr:AP2 domain transcription factor AP2-O5, putative [Plasmodium vivax]
MINYDENADAAGSQKESPPNSAAKNGAYEKGVDVNEPEVYDANEDNTKNKGVWYNARTKCWLACVKGSGRHLRVFSVKKHGFKRARMLAVECKNSTVINFNALANGEANGAANGTTNGATNGEANGAANGASSQADHPPRNNGVYAKFKNEPSNHVSGRTRTYSYNEAGRSNHSKLEAQESMDVGSIATVNSENASGVTNASISASASANGAEERPDRKRRYNTRRGNYKSVEELNKKEEKNETNEEDASFYKASNTSSVSPPTSRGYSVRGNYNTKGSLTLKGSGVTKGGNYNSVKRNNSISKGNGGSPKGGSNNLRGMTISKVSQAKGNLTKGGGSNSISKGQQSNGYNFHHSESSSYNLTTRSSRNYHATTDRCSSNSLTADEVKCYKEERNQSVQTPNGKRQSDTLVEALDSYQGDSRKKKKTTKDKFSYLVRKDRGAADDGDGSGGGSGGGSSGGSGDGNGNSNGGEPAATSASAYHEGSSLNDHNSPGSHATHSAHNANNSHNTRNTRNSSAHAVQFAENGQGEKSSHDDFQNVPSLNTRSSTTQNYRQGTHNEGYNNGYDSIYHGDYHTAQQNQQNCSSGRTYHNTRSSSNARFSNNTRFGNNTRTNNTRSSNTRSNNTRSNSTQASNTQASNTQASNTQASNARSSNNTCIITDKDFQIDSPEQTNEDFYFLKPMTYDYNEHNTCKQRNNKTANSEREYNFIFSNDCYSDYCSQNRDEYKANFIDLTREALSLILQDLKKNVIPKIPVGIEKRERYTNSLRLCLKSAKFTKHINELEPYLELFSECIKNSKLPSHMDLKDQLFYLDKL